MKTRRSKKADKVPPDPWLRLIEYLLVLRSPIPASTKEKRLKELEA